MLTLKVVAERAFAQRSRSASSGEALDMRWARTLATLAPAGSPSVVADQLANQLQVLYSQMKRLKTCSVSSNAALPSHRVATKSHTSAVCLWKRPLYLSIDPGMMCNCRRAQLTRQHTVQQLQRLQRYSLWCGAVARLAPAVSPLPAQLPLWRKPACPSLPCSLSAKPWCVLIRHSPQVTCPAVH